MKTAMTFAEKTLADAIAKLNAEYAELETVSFNRRSLARSRVEHAWNYAKTWANLVYPTLSEKQIWSNLRACVPAINTRWHS